MDEGLEESPRARAVAWIGLALGPLAALLIAWFTWPHASAADALGSAAGAAAPAKGGLTPEGAMVLGLMGWMAVWWLTQAVELTTTALLPVILLPLTGAGTLPQAVDPFASDIIFLFAGGYMLAIALEKHGLSRRFAALILGLAGANPTRIVGAILISTCAISAFVSNTATAAMMLPLALAVVRWAEHTAPDQEDRAAKLKRFASALLLCVAYGASIGGAATLIGSPPNAIAASILGAAGHEITFDRWAKFALPTVIVFMTVVWFLLSRVLIPVGSLRLRKTHDLDAALGGEGEPMHAPLTRSSWWTLAVFLAAVALWVGLPLLPKGAIPWKGSSTSRDAAVAVGAALLLLIIPLGRSPRATALSWHDGARLPWGVLLLFGGGLSIAEAMERHGVPLYLSQAFHGLAGAPVVLVIAAVVAAMIFISEFASNTALTAAALPILLALAPMLKMAPEQVAIPATLGASWAFMLPVGTPPNALVFATGRVPSSQMARVGFVLNLAAAAVITGMAMLLL